MKQIYKKISKKC